MNEPPALQPLPTPPDFPVEWQGPEEPLLLWQWANTHFPGPVSPLGWDLAQIAIAPGMEHGIKALGTPVREFRTRQLNTFAYMSLIPDLDLLPTAQEKMQAVIRERGFTTYQRWVEEWLPLIEADSQRLLDFDHQQASDAELAAFLDWTLDADARAWQIHFDLLPGFYLAAIFKEGCARLLDLPALDAYELMQGDANMSVEASSTLWRLAHTAPASVQETLRSLPSAEALERLGETEEGRAFLADLDGYLQQYGWRTGSLDITEPSWVEEPRRAIDHARLLLRVETDPAIEQQRGAERAEARAEECRAKLADDPAKLGEFNALYAAAKQYPRIQENHNFYLDQKFRALVRRPFIEVGRRMAAAGLLAEAGDVVYLPLAEVQAFLAGDRSDRKAAVSERRAEMERWRQRVPPPVLGALPLDLPQDPFWSDFFGVPPEPSSDPKVVKGTGASRGTVTGTARVIRSLAETDRVEEGDILVCDMTTPAWTPLFAGLSGIVADSGGMLSHCAVLAREYGLPCVTGTIVGTRVIPDGAQITIDGGQGIVRIL